MKIEIERSVVQQALDALTGIDRADDYKDFLTLEELEITSSAMLALREALAAPQPEAALWAIHIPGPDDYHAAPSKEAAQNMAEKHNAAMAEFFKSMPIGDLPAECTMASVVHWPGFGCDHAEEIAGFDYEAWGLRAEPASPGNQLADINVADMAAPNSVEFDGIKTEPAQQESVASTARGAIMGAAYDFRDAHISGSNNLKRSAHAALESAVDAALQHAQQEPVAWGNISPGVRDGQRVLYTSKALAEAYDMGGYQSGPLVPLYTKPQQVPQPSPDALHLAAMDLARKQAQRIAELEQQLAARGPLTKHQLIAKDHPCP